MIRIYQVLPRLWGDGKLSSWDRESLEYLKSLHVDYVWYTGIIRHASGKEFVKGDPGSPYAISDYHDVNPYLADVPEDRMAEFDALIARTHAAGLKAIVDFVPNHVARDCRDVPTCGWCDYDWTDTLKIDYNAPGTWDRMLEIGLFWAGHGVDGFRCDMVEMVPLEFMRWFIENIKRQYPDFLFVAEVYKKQDYRTWLNYAGFSLLYDKSGFYDRVRDMLCNGASARNLTWNWQSLGDIQTGMLNFLENHDEQRFSSPAFAGNPRKAFCALAAGMLFNGASFMLYFGQELGEAAPESDNARTSIFNWTEPGSSMKIWSSIHGIEPLSDTDSDLLEAYRSISALSATPLFETGLVHDLCYCNENSSGFNPDRHFAFLRYNGDEAALVACNFSQDDADMTLHIPEIKGCHPVGDGIRIKVKAYGYSVVKL